MQMMFPEQDLDLYERHHLNDTMMQYMFASLEHADEEMINDHVSKVFK